MNENSFKSDVLIDILLGNENTTNDQDYNIIKQTLVDQYSQLRIFPKFYRIMEMYNDKSIDPYKYENFEILHSFDFSKYGNEANKYKEFQLQVDSNALRMPFYYDIIINEHQKNFSSS